MCKLERLQGAVLKRQLPSSRETHEVQLACMLKALLRGEGRDCPAALEILATTNLPGYGPGRP